MMELRDWLIVLGVLVLVVVAADAVRRVRGRNRLRLKIDNKFKDLPDHGNDDVGEVRVVRADKTAAEPREPSFNDADLIGDVGSDSRREPALREPSPRRGDDFDLLMDGDFQGVGEGAGDYLGKPRVVSQPEVAEAAEHEVGSDQPDSSAEVPAAQQEPEIDPASSPAVPESALYESDDTAEDEKQPTEPSAEDSVEAADRAGAEPTAATDPIDAPATERRGETVIESMIESMIEEGTDEEGTDEEAPSATSVGTGADGLAQETTPSAEKTKVSASPSAATSKSPVEAAPAESAADTVPVEPASPAMTVVDAPADTLDLTRPVPEILAEQARKAASEAAIESADESPTDTAADPLVAGETAGQSPASTNDDAALGAAPDDKAVDAVLGAADGRDEPSVDEVAGAVGDEARSASAEKAKSDAGKGGKGKKDRREPRPEVQTTFFEHYPDLAPEPAASKARKSGATRTAKPAKPKEPQPAPDEVLVITVMARHDPFSGRALFKLVEACGLTFGRMSIFHRHEQDNGEGPVQFSMVNAVHPGTFQPDEVTDFTTPGVTFFLTMSEPSKLMEAFDCMLATAQCVADNLAGELRDEHRSSLRSQTIEHYRQKVRDFERRRLARRA